MSQLKPRIVKFHRHQAALSLDWETLEQSFCLAIEHGDAEMYSPSASADRFRCAIGSRVDAANIRKFVLRQDAETQLTEVILECAHAPNETSLGLTDNLHEAQSWINDANLVVQRHRQELAVS